jgi:murein DD-endopeptidase MepM/ murein hydrolase activator NlpD
MKKLLLWSIALVMPITASASIAEELNSFLDYFFDTPSSSETAPLRSPSADESSLQIEDIQDLGDLESLQKKIIASENNLEEYEQGVRSKERELWLTQTKQKTTQENIQLLDQQLSIQTQKLDKIQTQKEIWEKELETITREKEDIKAQIRAYQEDYENTLIQEVIRQQSLTQDRDVQLLKWFFSSKTISQILDERSVDIQRQEINQKKIQRLKNAQKFLENNENHAARVYNAIKELEQKSTQEKLVLSEFLNAKARLEQKLMTSQAELEREIENAYRSRERVLTELNNLHQKWDIVNQTTPELERSPQSLFAFPLSVPMQLTAGFQDPEYEKTFGFVHDGADFFAPQGSDILAPADGIVQKTEIQDEDYAYLILNHGNNLYTVYGHVSEILVNEGDSVSQGTLIAKTGGTPGTKGAGYLTTGPHLHFSVFVNGEFVDPLLYLPETN